MTGHCCFRQSGLLAAPLHTDTRNVRLSYSSYSPNALASGASKFFVDHTFSRSVSSVY